MNVQFSLLVAHVLDFLGYSEEARKWRIKKYGEHNFLAGLCSQGNPFMQIMLSGSKAEGTSIRDESDFDFLIILKGVKATECTDIDPPDRDLVFLLDCTSAPPGYCKLKLLQEECDNVWHRSFHRWDCYRKPPGSCRWQLSSMAVVKGHHSESCSKTPISGPSSPYKRQGWPDKDIVLAIKCTNIPFPLQAWFSRHRLHGWPAPDLLKQLSLLPVYVVPVGMTGNEEKYLQWRISTNMMEKMLIHNFNNLQSKVYILVKMVVKEVVRSKYPDSISSYIVKILMFWSIEQNSPRFWTDCTLLNSLLYLINMLQHCVQNGNCPNYFIPDNNLLQNKLTLDTQRGICELLTTLLHEGPSCVLRCTKIHQHINLYLFSPAVINVDQYNRKDRHHMNKDTVVSINIACHDITESTLLLGTSPFMEIFSDIVSEATTAEEKEKEICKYFFCSSMMQFVLCYHVLVVTWSSRNTCLYRKIQQSLAILHDNSKTDVMSGKVLFALALHLTGQNNKAQEVLEDSFGQLRYYAYRAKNRSDFKGHNSHPKLLCLLESRTLNPVRFMKQFTQCDLRLISIWSACIPKAVQYEFYRTCDKIEPELFVDSDFFGFYLQYLIHKEIRLSPHVDAAFSNLVWCATQSESNIEYREVALNVLGHCFMQMKKYEEAVKCLVKSVQLTQKYPPQNPLNPTGNAALWHIAILLNKKLNGY